MPYVDFKAIKAAVSIEDAANLLKLTLKKSGTQFRSTCPACGNDDERTIVLTPARGLFYCFDAKVGGDCLALVQHITGLDVQDAAAFLSPHARAAHDSPVPEQKKAAATKKETAFDPVAFASKLQFTDEVAELGISEEDATRLQIGFTRYPQRGRQYQRVCRICRRSAQNAARLDTNQRGETETCLAHFLGLQQIPPLS